MNRIEDCIHSVKRFFLSIPHVSLLLEDRRHERFQPRNDQRIDILVEQQNVDAFLRDISYGGMRIICRHNRIASAKTISLQVDDKRIDLPCKKMRTVGDNCFIEFGDVRRGELKKLGDFIECYGKLMP